MANMPCRTLNYGDEKKKILNGSTTEHKKKSQIQQQIEKKQNSFSTDSKTKVCM